MGFLGRGGRKGAPKPVETICQARNPVEDPYKSIVSFYLADQRSADELRPELKEKYPDPNELEEVLCKIAERRLIVAEEAQDRLRRGPNIGGTSGVEK